MSLTSESDGENLNSLRDQLEKITSSPLYEASWASKQRKNLESKANNFPDKPSWISNRPFLSGDFLGKENNRNGNNLNQRERESNGLELFPTSTQEVLILEDLLFVMVGIEGRYIKLNEIKNDLPSFIVEATLDPSLANLVSKIIPLCCNYIYITKYLQKHSWFNVGTINHAFCACLRKYTADYLLLTAQLEQQLREGQLSLQKCWFYVQTPLKIMETLYKIVSGCQGLTGGPLINSIYTKLSTLSGDQQLRELVQTLLTKASEPMFSMLEKWIYKGIISDPFDEFFIKEREDLKKENLNEDFNDKYWEQRFTIKQESLPAFLIKVSERILVTGKYLNVIRECAIHVDFTTSKRLEFTSNEREYQEKIDVAYHLASKRLLDLLMMESNLISRLRSIKHYFLLDQGDFFLHFMDISGEELRRSAGDINVGKLNSLLELSLRTSIADSDPHKDDLSCVLLPYKLLHQLMKIIHVSNGSVQVNTSGQTRSITLDAQKITGLEAFSFDYKVRWPLSLVISRKSLTKYQLIFRHLFLCKYVERQLCTAWGHHQSMKELDLRRALSSSFSLRQRMMQFLQNVLYYMMFEVMEPNWQLLEKNLREANTIDEVLKYHNDFLDVCLKECMLTDPNLIKTLNRLTTMCILFATFTDRFIQSLQTETEKEMRDTEPTNYKRKQAARIKVITEQARRVANDENFKKTVESYENNFNITMKHLMDSLQLLSTTEANHQMANLVLRLDYNDYYKKYFEANPINITSTPSSSSRSAQRPTGPSKTPFR
eukprot:TRINITY_DN7283_c0_g1_i1.p1 TRINITY_DN7283_c0_g1~~TRINITY_DN7283_c0_g1_i1.p1  ORF type:complete len:773 (-),score=225.32 TRINITY_DN7283_c0_g1_i1:228-2546(-)